jgi:transcriptional regulator with XRE-family HTH domain
LNIENLKKAREKAGLTQAQAAIAIGVSDGTYKNYEQGKREPNGDKMVTIANLFGVTTDYLLGRETQIKDPIETMMNQLHLNLYERAIVSAYLAMDTKSRSDLVKMVQNVAQNVADATKNGTESKRCTYTVQVAARGGDQPHTVEITPEEKERIANLPRVPDDL